MNLRDQRTNVLGAERHELSRIEGPVARHLEAECRESRDSTSVVIVTLENEVGQTTALVVDATWLDFAAESISKRPELADGLKLPVGAVIAELPCADVLLDPPRDQSMRWTKSNGTMALSRDC